MLPAEYLEIHAEGEEEEEEEETDSFTMKSLFIRGIKTSRLVLEHFLPERR